MAGVVITALNTFANRGVEALGLSIVDGLQSALPQSQIQITTRDMDGAARAFAGRAVTLIPDSAWAPDVHASRPTKALFRARRQLRWTLGRSTPAEDALRAADLVVVSGGDVFSSDYAIMERYLRQLDQVCAQKKPLLFLAQSIGPFTTAAELESFRNVARFATFTVRERISEEYLTSVVGVPADRVHVTADPAFLLPVDDGRKRELLDHYGLNGPFVGLAVSRGISGFSKVDHGDHVRAWIEAVRTLARNGVTKVALIPHVQLPHAESDDLTLARELAPELSRDLQCVVCDGDHSAMDFKAILSGANFVIAERTHGAIGAMSQGVPTLSVGYSIKARGVLEGLVGDQEILRASLVSANEFCDAARTTAVVEAAWRVKERFAAALSASVPQAKADAARNFTIARSLVAAGR